MGSRHDGQCWIDVVLGGGGHGIQVDRAKKATCGKWRVTQSKFIGSIRKTHCCYCYLLGNDSQENNFFSFWEPEPMCRYTPWLKLQMDRKVISKIRFGAVCCRRYSFFLLSHVPQNRADFFSFLSVNYLEQASSLIAVRRDVVLIVVRPKTKTTDLN